MITEEMEIEREKNIREREEHSFQFAKRELLETYLLGHKYNHTVGGVRFKKFKKRLHKELPELKMKFRMGGLYTDPYIKIKRRRKHKNFVIKWRIEE